MTSLSERVVRTLKRTLNINPLRILLGLLPFIGILRGYSLKKDLPKDVVAGITVGIMHVPQGMGYAMLCSIPPIYGLYVSLIPPLVYFILGTSRHVSIGTFAIVCLMLGNTVDRYQCEQYDVTSGSADTTLTTMVIGNMTFAPTTSAPTTTISSESAKFGSDIECRLAVLTATSCLAALIQLAMWACRLGFFTVYLSTPLTRGLTTGAACHVFTGQIKHVFGLSVDKFSGPLNLAYKCINMFSQVVSVNLYVLAFASIIIALLILFKEIINPKFKKRFHMPFPIELLIIIVSTLTSYLLDLETSRQFQIVGDIPTGLPAPKYPAFNLFEEVLYDAIPVAIVSFVVNMSLAKTFASKHNYAIDSNQELLALSLSNIFGSFFNCFYAVGSMSRSLVSEGVGAVSQVSSLVSGGLLVFVIFFIGPLFSDLPIVALAAIIIVNLKGIFLQFYDLGPLWEVSKFDFFTWIVVFVSVFLMDVTYGLCVGVVFCLFTVIWRSQVPYSSLVTKVGETDVYADINSYENEKEMESVKIFRFECSLNFTNCEQFSERLMKLKQKMKEIKTGTKVCPTDDGQDELRYVIIDFSTIPYIDTTAIAMLEQVVKEYTKCEKHLYIAACKGHVLTTLHTSGFMNRVPSDCLYASVRDAVEATGDVIQMAVTPALITTTHM